MDKSAEMEIVNLGELEAAAREKLEGQAYDYYAGGSGDQETLGENRRAFSRWQLRPRVLVDVAERDLSCEILGQRLSWPLLLAPTAFHALAHPDGELATARAAAARETVYVVSTLASRSLAEIAQASDGPKWFQLYCARERKITETLVRRAEDLGYLALVLTVDMPVAGRREADLRNRFRLPSEAQPKNLLEFAEVEDDSFGDPSSHLTQIIDQLFDPTLTWNDLEWLRDLTSLPILVKGILTAEDARLAIEHGADGIVVSNHGGRQLDGVPATIEAIEEIHDEVAGHVPVLMDGGIRRGVDVVKALALGADAVLIGRPYLWGLAAAGQEGVEKVIELLREEFSTALALLGCKTPAELGRRHLRRASH